MIVALRFLFCPERFGGAVLGRRIHVRERCVALHVLELVDRHLEEDVALFVRLGHLACAHVDLKRGDDELGHGEGRVAGIAHLDKGILVLACADVNIRSLLFAYRGFPRIFIAARCLVVVADKDAGFIGQGEDFLNRVVERFGGAAGEVTACGAEIGHEERIAYEGRVPDDIGEAGGGMAGRVQDVAAQLPNMEAIAFDEKLVELASVALEFGAFVEDLAEGVLNDLDAITDADFAADMVLNIGGGGEVVGVDVAFEKPFDVQAFFFDKGDDFVGGLGICAAGRIVKVKDAVDNGAGRALGIFDDIRNCIRGIVEKCCDFRFHDNTSVWKTYNTLSICRKGREG